MWFRNKHVLYKIRSIHLIWLKKMFIWWDEQIKFIFNPKMPIELDKQYRSKDVFCCMWYVFLTYIIEEHKFSVQSNSDDILKVTKSSGCSIVEYYINPIFNIYVVIVGVITFKNSNHLHLQESSRATPSLLNTYKYIPTRL